MPKKQEERFFVEEAAKLLGKTWALGPDRESPDFIVTEGAQKFGLEVSQVFSGPQSKAGAEMKKRESKNQKVIKALQADYENVTDTPLWIRLLGDISSENIAEVVPALLAEDFASKPICSQAQIDLNEGLSVYATKAFRADWLSVNDRVGWVDMDPIQRLADAVEKKSKKLPEYKEAIGLDIRLLLVADRTFKSGKLMLKEGASLDTRGFQVVYFFSYPDTPIVFS